MTESASDAPKRTLGDGRYELVQRLGQGGMAEVWLARDSVLRVERAVKIILGHGHAAEVRSRRLSAEAHAMARIGSRHILTVHDIARDGDTPFIVMDYLPGGTLEDALRREGPLPPRKAVRWMMEVLSALEAAHQRSVIHRDVKPSNILLDAEGRAVLADFGIALLADDDIRHTKIGVTMGSMGFMAPEQRLDARNVGPAADLYAAAATLYHLLTASTPVDLFTADENSPRWAEIPDDLRSVLFKVTRLDPSHRPATAAEFRRSLAEIVDHLPETPLQRRGGPMGALTDEHSFRTAPPVSAGQAPTLFTAETSAPSGRGSAAPWIGLPLAIAVLVALGMAVQGGDGGSRPGRARDAGSPGISQAPGVPSLPAPSVPEAHGALEGLDIKHAPVPGQARKAEAPPAPTATQAPPPGPAASVAAPGDPLGKRVGRLTPLEPPSGWSTGSIVGDTTVAGRWKGSFDSDELYMVLRGSDARVTGTVWVRMPGGVAEEHDVVGSYQFEGRSLVLADIGEAASLGRYTFRLSTDERLLVDGQFVTKQRRPDGRTIVALSAARQD